MKKLLYLLVLIIPLSAQEVKEEVENKEPEQCCVEKETTTQKVVRHLQDAEWRKFQAAHRRAHSKRGEEHSVRESRGKKHKVRQLVRLVVVGGLAYYIGYHQGEEHFKGGWNKRKYDWGDRK